jgi:hypothetical protein
MKPISVEPLTENVNGQVSYWISQSARETINIVDLTLTEKGRRSSPGDAKGDDE